MRALPLDLDDDLDDPGAEGDAGFDVLVAEADSADFVFHEDSEPAAVQAFAPIGREPTNGNEPSSNGSGAHEDWAFMDSFFGDKAEADAGARAGAEVAETPTRHGHIHEHAQEEEEEDGRESPSESDSDSDSSAASSADEELSSSVPRRSLSADLASAPTTPPAPSSSTPKSSASSPAASAAPSASTLWGSSVSFLKKSAKKAMTLAAGEGVATSQQRAVLGALAAASQQRFSADGADGPEGLDTLKSCWKAAFPGEAFSRSGPQWQLLGFRADDPVADETVQEAGELGYRCLAYHLEHNFGRGASLKRAADCSIALAPCAARACARIGAHACLPGRAFEDSSRLFWPLFDNGAGCFLEVVSVALTLAQQARDSSASDSDAEALEQSVDSILAILDQGPRNVDSFYQLARKDNLNI